MYYDEFDNSWTLGEYETGTIGAPSFSEYECGFDTDSLTFDGYECDCDWADCD